jgi:hypothetical protein
MKKIFLLFNKALTHACAAILVCSNGFGIGFEANSNGVSVNKESITALVSFKDS